MKVFCTTVLLIFFAFLASSQESETENKPTSPTIGVGVGTIGFYGDLNDRKYGSPFSSNPGFKIYLIQPITDYLNLNLNFLQGNIREEERSLQRSLNFQTDIFLGSMMLEYNFSNFLPEERNITPFISTGIEIIDFNPKSDLRDGNDNSYNYWKDGTIRNIPENASNADQAQIIQRDYTYESDIRNMGFSQEASFSKSAFAIPVGIGVTMHLNDQFDFRFESIFHFSFTDNIDGYSENSPSEVMQGKSANSRNDKFYYNGISLSYNFEKVEGAEPFDIEKKEIDSEPIDYLATGNTEDFDGDGIIDLIDHCPNSPADIEVDSLGCPVDTDGDGVPDYKDEEINSRYPEFANDKGVEMTDDMIYESYMRYLDSALAFAEVIERNFSERKINNRKYRVKVGEYNKGETPEDMSTLLSLRDLNKIDQGDKTLYTVGNYKTIPEAVQRENQLKSQGFKDTDVLKRNSKGEYTSAGLSQQITQDITKGEEIDESSTIEGVQKEEDPNEVVFRVQLGAFKTKPTDSKYNEIPNLFIMEANGFYRYMSGSFSDFNSAAKHKVKMIVKGFKGAFVVAYKGGKKVSLKSVGVESINSDPLIGK